MQEVWRGSSLSLMQATLLRLQTEGIEARSTGESLAGVVGDGFRIVVADADLARARDLLAGETTTSAD